MANEKNKIYSVRQLSRFFGVTEATIWDWCKTGRLPAFKIGKEWRVRVIDLQRMINAKMTSPSDRRTKLF
jgi:excisionase family DNA binding protein